MHARIEGAERHLEHVVTEVDELQLWEADVSRQRPVEALTGKVYEGERGQP